MRINGEWLHCMGVFFVLALWPFISFSPALMQVALWLGVGLVLSHWVIKRQRPALPDRTSLVLIGLFFAAVLFSLLVTDYPKQSFRGSIKVLRQIAVLLVVFHVFRFTEIQKKMRWVVAGSFLLLASDGFFQYFTGNDFLRGFAAQDASSGRRISASLEHYGKLAAYLCVVLPVIFGFTLSSWRDLKRRRELLIWLPLSLAGLALLVLTRSRGGMLAFFFGAITIFLLRRSWKILGVMLLTGLLFVSVLPRSMIIHLDAENKEQSVIERFELWHRAWDVIQARPLTGTGINTYSVAHQQFDTRKNWRVQNYYAHNGYLQTAAEIGVPGTLALIFFLFRWLWIYRPRPSESGPGQEIQWGLMGGVITFMIFCLGDTAMHSPQPIAAFWYVVGLLGAFQLSKKV